MQVMNTFARHMGMILLPVPCNIGGAPQPAYGILHIAGEIPPNGSLMRQSRRSGDIWTMCRDRGKQTVDVRTAICCKICDGRDGKIEAAKNEEVPYD